MGGGTSRKSAPARALAASALFRKGCASLIACSVFLTGCTAIKDYVHHGFKVGPNYGRPPAPVAADWIDAHDVRVRRESEDAARWWMVFGDPALDSLVATAYAQNLTLREAGFRILEARARLGIAIGNIFPQQQDYAGGYSRLGLSTAVANRQFIAESFYNQWAHGFDLAWELDFWGRFRRAVEAADRDLDASVENYDDVLVTLIADVASTYTQIRTLEKRIELAKANVALQRETLSVAEARFRGGAATELDVDQAKSLLAQTEAIVPQFEISLRVANNALCVLLGIPPEELRRQLGAGPIPTAPPSVAVGIPAELLARRPDVRRAEREAAAQCARIGVAVADLYPHISIVGTIGYQAINLPDLFTSPAFRGTIGPSFQWNVLNYGRLLNRVRLEDARFEELVAKYQNTVLEAGQQVENGLVTFLRSQTQAQFLGQSVEAAERAVRVSIAQYRGGTVDFNRVSLLEQNLVTQQDNYAQAQGQIALGLIQVYRALGGGWQIRLDPPPALGIVPTEPAAPPAPETVDDSAVPFPEVTPHSNPPGPSAAPAEKQP